MINKVILNKRKKKIESRLHHDDDRMFIIMKELI